MQTQLTGWLNKVIEGNEIRLDSAKSPNLNHFKSQGDRQPLIGEKSLRISD